MRVQELIGKVVIRTKVIEERGDLLGSNRVDASYTNMPILIEAEENGVVYYRSSYSDKVGILSPRFHDDNWAPISEKYLQDLWPTKERANVDGFTVGRKPTNSSLDVRVD